MFDIQACRGCLCTKSKLEKMTSMTKKMYAAVTGLEINSADGLPNYFCVECHANIKKLLAFRRRCRRAYYVMKEIISINKQLTLNNLMSVSRVKTNLKSPYNFSSWYNRSYYTIDIIQPDIDTMIASLDKYEPGDKPLELIKHEIDTKSMVFHIDIEPTQEVSILPQLQAEMIEPENVETNQDAEIEDHAPMDVEDTTFPEDTPFNDGFEEKFNDSESDNDDTKETDATILKKNRQDKILSKKVQECCSILADSSIRVLNLDEQKKAFESRLEEDTFKFANYKCALCVLVTESMQDLVKHIEIHKESQSYPISCPVCKVRFKDETHLAAHNSIIHSYEYKCKRCDAPPLYTLYLAHMRLLSRQCRKIFVLFLGLCIRYFTAGYNNPESEKEDISLVIEIENNKDILRNLRAAESSTTDIITHHKREHPTRDELPVKLVKMLDHFRLTPCTDEEMRLLRYLPISTHKCTECGMSFVRQQSLGVHVRKHKLPTMKADSSAKQCDICGIYYKSESVLQYHIQCMHKYTYQCKMCKLVAYNIREAEHHLSKHGSLSMKYLCEFCENQFNTEKDLMSHRIASHYSKTHTHHCIVCGLSHTSEELLYQHQVTTHETIRIHDPSTGNKDHFCQLCEFQFLSLNAYRTHALKHGHDDAKNFENVCMTCKIIFESEQEMKNHDAACTNNKKNEIKCPYCDEVMTCGKKLFLHHKRSHPGNAYLPVSSSKLCEQCGQWVQDLKDHLKRHTITDDPNMDDNKLFDCVYCYPLRKFKGLRRYASHMVRIHTARPYVCMLCSKSFLWSSECRDHILKVHSPVELYKCAKCDKTFSHNEFLEDHSVFAHFEKIEVPKIECTNTMTLYVYPHMKLNISLLDKSVLSQIKIELWDYLHKKKEELEDFTEYVVLDKPEVGAVKNSQKKSRKKKKRQKEREQGDKKPKRQKKKTSVKVTEVVECLDNLEVVEYEGERFVNINGLLYKIAETEG